MMEISNEMLDVLAANVGAVDFDHPFTVTVFDSKVWRLEDAHGVYAPNVDHNDHHDIDIDEPGWEALTGFTGQHGYNGACMHSSEYVSRAIAAELVRLAEDEPQTYVMVVVSAGVVEDDEEDEPAGWAILRKVSV